MSSDCGTVDRAVAVNNRGPRFQTSIEAFYVVVKTKIEKEAGNRQF